MSNFGELLLRDEHEIDVRHGVLQTLGARTLSLTRGAEEIERGLLGDAYPTRTVEAPRTAGVFASGILSVRGSVELPGPVSLILVTREANEADGRRTYHGLFWDNGEFVAGDADNFGHLMHTTGLVDPEWTLAQTEQYAINQLPGQVAAGEARPPATRDEQEVRVTDILLALTYMQPVPRPRQPGD